MESRPRESNRARLLVELHGENSSSMPRGCGDAKHNRGPVVCIHNLMLSAALPLKRHTGLAGRCKWLHRATKTVNADAKDRAKLLVCSQGRVKVRGHGTSTGD
ncbi:hypothetical protein KVT40_001972 [Elsinoe batatas]|uniref:Uncharacterized protein n=1 Tax=Elsinoe batatas TaxID=2601811 RepID=A0A8K0LDR7_9PEZI|nr:hypothetical protein KVT40_001972 [Elsinoe batatas]